MLETIWNRLNSFYKFGRLIKFNLVYDMIDVAAWINCKIRKDWLNSVQESCKIWFYRHWLDLVWIDLIKFNLTAKRKYIGD